ncbi:MAG: hypothetical protein ABUL77_00955 [Bacteroidota bacterium]
MKRLFLFPGFAAVVGVLGVVGGCAPSTKVKAGAPVMLTFLVLDPAGAPIDLAPDGGVAKVPPLSKVYALFDRLLDPVPLAQLDAGVPEPRPGVAIIDADGTAVPSKALYVPNGDPAFTVVPAAFGLPYANGPSVTITPSEGLPSGAAAVTVSLDPEKVRSHDQKMRFVVGPDAPETLTFSTESLAATIAVPAPEPPDGGAGGDVAPPVDPDFVVQVSFNNLTSVATKDEIKVTATVEGAPVTFAAAPAIGRDVMNPAVWNVTPPTAGWPAGASVTVTVTAAVSDNFQHTLGTAVSASFTVKP